MARNLANDSIPMGWNYDFLDKFTERCSGHTPSQSFPEYWNGGVKWISLSDSYRLDKGYVYNTEKQISNEGLKHSSAVLLPAETVVLSRDAGIGKSGVMAEPMAVSQHFIAWKCDNVAKINSWFLYNWLQLHKKEFERQAVGSTIKTIGLPYFKKLKIAIPPYKEQKKIAKILSTWDKAIDTVEQLVANSQQQKKALMQQLLTGKKRFSGFTDEWQEFRLGDVAEMNSGGTPKSSVDSYYGGGIPWVSISDMTSSGKWIKSTEKTLTSKGLDNSSARLYPKYTVLYAMYASIGECGIAKEELCSSQAILGIRTSAKLYYEYLYYYLTSIKDVIKLQGQQGTQANLNAGMVKDFKILLPSVKEQKEIVLVISTADKEIESLQRHLDYLIQEKKSLMQQLLTGKRRVKTHSKEEASC